MLSPFVASVSLLLSTPALRSGLLPLLTAFLVLASPGSAHAADSKPTPTSTPAAASAKATATAVPTARSTVTPTATAAPANPTPTPAVTPTPATPLDAHLPGGGTVAEYLESQARPGIVIGETAQAPAGAPRTGATTSQPADAAESETEADRDEALRAERRREALVLGAARLSVAPDLTGFWKEVQLRDLVTRTAQGAGADAGLVAALMEVDSGDATIWPGGMKVPNRIKQELLQPGDDPSDQQIVLQRAAEHIRILQDRWHLPELVAAAYFGALNEHGAVTAEEGGLDGFDYVQRFRVAYQRYVDGNGLLPGWLVSPFGTRPVDADMIKFGYYGDYGEELAFEIRGEQGVAQFGTVHFGLDLQIPGLPDGGRGAPVVAPFDGTIVRTADPAGGPFGILLENRQLNLRARLMHMDGLVQGIETGVQVRAGQQLGILGAQGTEGFPHLHLAFDRLSDGERINPALFYRIRDASDPATAAGRWPVDLASWAALPWQTYASRLLPLLDRPMRVAPISRSVPVELPVS
jgi:murein DD-endopeptidase MepM/ murein hydrolase activator NlpD